MQPYSFANSKHFLDHFQKSAKLESVIVTIFGLLQVCMTIAFAYLIARLLDDLLYKPTPELPDLSFWLLAFGALFGRSLAEYIQISFGHRASVKIRSNLRAHCLQQCNDLNIRLYPDLNTTELTNLLISEIDSLKVYFSDYAAQKRLAILMPVAVLIASSYVGWLVPLMLAVTAPLVPIFMILAGHKAAEASRNNLQQLNRLGTLLSDRLKNITCLQIAGTVDIEEKRIYQQSDMFRQSTMKVLRLAFLSGALLEFFSAISVALIAVYLGLFYLDKYQLGIWSNDLTLFDGVFLLMLAPEFYLPLRKLGALYHAKADAESVADHILTLDQVSKKERNSQQTPPDQSVSEQISDISELKTFTISNFQAGSKQSPIHAPVSFRLEPGNKLLVRGPSGSGKTSLLDSLAGLRPQYTGEILINDQSVSLFQQESWYRQVGYMSQKPELIYASIRDNLSLGRAFTDEELYRALQLVQADELVMSLPHQLGYQVSDSGGFLSGGQAQRVALARVFLHQPKLLLLDEPTASLDQETASEFLKSLDLYCQSGGIVIMASHRPTDQAFFSDEISIKPNREYEV